MSVTRGTRSALAVSSLAFTWYTVFSLQRLKLHRTGLDLAIFDQAVRHLAHFEAPISHIKGQGFNLFGDHFHPIIALAVPPYWIHPDARTLLVVQAAAIALSVWIVTRLAQRHLGPAAGLCVGSAYAVSWGLQTALAFDFHEVSLGVPLMAAAASAYLEARWRSAYLWTASLLLVKEDLALTVAAFGVYLCLQRRVRAGITMVAGAIAWAALVVWVLVPAFSPYGRYTYWSSLDQPPSPIRPQETALDWSSLVFNGTKWHTLLLLLVVVVFLPLLSPLTIAVLPTIGWRFLSGNSAYWGTRYHYSEILMPLLFIAAVDGVLRLRRWLRGRAPDTWVRRGAAVGMLGVSIALLPSFPFWQATESFFWQRCPRCADAELAVKAIPDDASVAADTLLMPELVDRTDVYLISPDFRDPTGRTFSVQYVLLDEAHRNLWPQPDWIGVLRQHLQERDFREVARHGDYVVYQR